MSISLTDVSYFNAKNGCMKCLVKGKFYEGYGTVFPSFEDELRTDQAFRRGEYGPYHHGQTPLSAIEGIDMVLDFPVGDSLHLIDLGNTKRILIGFIEGNLTSRIRFSADMRTAFNTYMRSLKKPNEIHRQIRGINEIAHWKATEFRTFLLYISIVIFKKFLPVLNYEHFLSYFCAITICSSEYHISDLIDLAGTIMKDYLKNFKILYGSHNCVSNLHNLCHLVGEVRRFGPLFGFSAYPFESKLFDIKSQLRSGHLPLSQIGKRMIEQENFLNRIPRENPKLGDLRKRVINFDQSNFAQLLPNDSYSIYAEIQLNEFIINNSDGNKYFLTDDLKIVQTKFIVLNEQSRDVFIYGSAYKTLKDFFEIPFESRYLHIYIAENDLSPSKLFKIESIKAKMFALPYAGDYLQDDYDSDIDDEEMQKEKIVFVPLIHTLK